MGLNLIYYQEFNNLLPQDLLLYVLLGFTNSNLIKDSKV